MRGHDEVGDLSFFFNSPCEKNKMFNIMNFLCRFDFFFNIVCSFFVFGL